MKKNHFVLILMILGLVALPSPVLAEMSKQGSGMLRTGKSGNVQILKMLEGHVQANWKEMGAVVEGACKQPFCKCVFCGHGNSLFRRW